MIAAVAAEHVASSGAGGGNVERWLPRHGCEFSAVDYERAAP